MLDDGTLTQGFTGMLGLQAVEASGDRVVLRLEVGQHLHQPYGVVHGGVHSAVVETAASIAGALWLGDAGQVVGVSNQTDFLRAVRGGMLTATATPVHRGRTQQLWVVEIRSDDEHLVARGQVRLQNLPARHLADR